MAALNFPGSPAPGDEYTVGDLTYTWTGEAWVVNVMPATPYPPPVVQIKRTPNDNHPPTTLKEGELAVEMGTPLRLWVGVPPALDPSGKKLLAERGSGDPYVDITGDTMSGDLTIDKVDPVLNLDKDSGAAEIRGLLAGVRRWVMRFGNNVAETGGDTGSEFSLSAYNDAGLVVSPAAMRIARNGNRIEVAGDPIDPNDVATKAYVDSSSVAAVPFDALAFNGIQVNGSFEVSQEKGFGVGINTSGYFCDGWKITKVGTAATTCAAFTAAMFTGFQNMLLNSVQTAQATMTAPDYVAMSTLIEGYRVARLSWGTANAQPLTIGFWTAHIRPGLYTGVVRNAANNRSYAFSYTQNAASTPQFNSVTIPGDTSGTWLTTTGIGMQVFFCQASGTTNTAPSLNTWLAGSYVAGPGQVNGVAATTDIFRLTGVIMLPGTVAPSAARSPLIMRPADTELILVSALF